MKTETKKESKLHNRRIAIGFALLCILLAALSLRLADIMIVDSDELTEMAVSQQTRDTDIDAKRGIIYDRNGKELATSSICYTLYIRPSVITEDKSAIEVKGIAQALADAIGDEDITAEYIEEKMLSENAIVTTAKHLDKEQYNAIRELGLSGIELNESTMRFYPLGNFASQLLGSVNDDGNGRTGLELQYDEYLSGVNGRWVINTDISGNELVEGTERYYEAQDGYNLILTIDEAIQYYVEEAIEEACEEWDATKVECLAMDPETGEILASAVYPGYDPNDPYTPQGLTKKQKAKYEAMSDEDKTAYLSKMWRNPIVSDTYEPGSTFKPITAAAAIEEKAISLSETFYCAGTFTVANYRLHCWVNGAHGKQTIKEAIANSCNPALAAVAKKLGATKFLEYINLFGFGSITGVDYPGEAGSLIQSTIGPVELANMGFGQGISITPLQLVTAISAIGNDGNLMKPHYVKAMTDSDGNVVETFEPQVVRQVISKKTAREMCEILEYEVSEGGGGTAKITGYKIGGKTGTAQKAESGGYSETDYYSSFICMAPMDDPKITLLVIVDTPQGAKYGSVVAAPVAKKILTNVLRYMGISPEYTDEELEAMNSGYTTVPDLVGKEFSDAAGIITGKGLKYSRPDSAKDDDEWEVVDQYPKAGTKVKQNTVVYVYKE